LFFPRRVRLLSIRVFRDARGERRSASKHASVETSGLGPGGVRYSHGRGARRRAVGV
jgi:hypothetical protein